MNLIRIHNKDSLTDEEVNKIILHHNNQNANSSSLDKSSKENNKAKAYHFLGICALDNQEFSNAKHFINKAISISPKNATFHNSLGNIFLAEGDVETSKKHYHEAILFNESFADTWNNLASLNFSEGHYKEAINNYQRSIEIDPSQADAWYHTGLIWEITGNYSEAESCFQSAEYYQPGINQAKFHLANVIQKQHRSQEALFLYNQLLKCNPTDINVLFNAGTASLSLGDFKKAHEFYANLLEINPDYLVQVHRNLGLAYHLEKHFFQAIQEYQVILLKFPDLADFHLYLGEVYYDLQDYAAAAHEFQIALNIDPNMSQAYHNLANIHKINGNPKEALDLFEKAIEKNPLSAKAHYDQAVLMKEEKQLMDSIVSFRESLRLAFDFLNARIQYGLIFLELGRVDDAISEFKIVLDQKADHSEAKRLISQSYLLKENFVEGWTHYSVSNFKSRIPSKHDRLPYWNGEPLNQNTIYINHTEQLEQQILFSTCLSDIIANSQKCIIEVEKEWVPIFQRSFPLAQIVSFENRIDLEYDLIEYQINICNLPRHFRNNISDFPVQWRTIDPDAQLNKQYSSRLNSLGKGMKIGLSIFSKDTTELEDRQKWIKELTPVLKNKNITYVNLHQEQEKIDLNTICNSNHLKIESLLDDEPNTPDQILAQISSCDLVITCDNLTAHLAGSLGISTWMLISNQPEWYWFLERENSLWYNSIRIFRKSQLGTWDDALAQINRELQRTITIRAESNE